MVACSPAKPVVACWRSGVAAERPSVSTGDNGHLELVDRTDHPVPHPSGQGRLTTGPREDHSDDLAVEDGHAGEGARGQAVAQVELANARSYGVPAREPPKPERVVDQAFHAVVVGGSDRAVRDVVHLPISSESNS